MWNWFNCYLSGRHEYGPWCEPGAMFLRCLHCGRRSPGWSIDAKPQSTMTLPASAKSSIAKAGIPAATSSVRPGRVVPFSRAAS